MLAIMAMAVDVSMSRSKSLASRIAAEPGEGALDHPPAGQQVKALGVAGALDDLEPQPLAGRSTHGDLALIPSIGEQLLQPGETPSDARADQPQAVAVLDVGGMHDQPQRQAQRVGEQVALAAVDLLAGIEPTRAAGFGGLDAWLSMIPAVGDASWPACSRAAMSRVAWIVDQMPSCQNRRK